MANYVSYVIKNGTPFEAGYIRTVIETEDKKMSSEEVKITHASWINNQNGTFTCSACGWKHSRSNYCPNCGLKMDWIIDKYKKENKKIEEELNKKKYWICCPYCDNEKCVKDTDACDAKKWADEMKKKILRNTEILEQTYIKKDDVLNILKENRNNTFVNSNGLIIPEHYRKNVYQDIQKLPTLTIKGE